MITVRILADMPARKIYMCLKMREDSQTSWERDGGKKRGGERRMRRREEGKEG